MAARSLRRSCCSSAPRSSGRSVMDVLSTTHTPPEQAMPVALVSWKAVRKGALLGFASIRLGRSLVINDVPVLASNGRRWASLPGRPVLAQDGQPKRDERGKPVYAPFAEWTDRASRDRFSDGVIAAVEREHPGDLEPEAAP